MENHKHYNLAYKAHYNTSHVPEKRAKSECEYYDSIQEEFAGNEYVLAKFERLFTVSLAAKSRCASAMITGPSNFPVARQEKAHAAERKHTDALLTFLEKARQYRDKPENTAISSDDKDAIEKLEKQLLEKQKAQEMMVQANKLIRLKDHPGLISLVGAAVAESLLKPSCFGRFGFEPFELSNNLASIKRLEKRIKELQAKKTLKTQEETYGTTRVVKNIEDNRLQIFFIGKPAPNMISDLKRHGFKWTPSISAWQRQLTANAMFSFKYYIFPLLKQEA